MNPCQVNITPLKNRFLTLMESLMLTLHLDGKASTVPQRVQIILAILFNRMTGPYKFHKLQSLAEH